MSKKNSSDGVQPITALIKFFSEKKHYLDFKNGSSFFRTPHYYRKCEGAGRSDRNESCIGFWDKKLGDTMPDVFHGEKLIDMHGIESILVYPLTEQKDAWIQSWSAIGPYNNFENSLQKMLDKFGLYFVILPSKNIINYAEFLSKKTNLPIRHGLMNYSNDPKKRSLTVKDSEFSYQKEYRFFFGECDKFETQDKIVELPNLEPILLEASSLKLESPSGEIKYCSLGHPNVIIGRSKQ